MKQIDIDYFENEKYNMNPIFFDRFSDIKFDDKIILDFGCGHGALSTDLAMKGAKEIIAVDLDNNLVNFASENLLKNFSEFSKKITFKCVDFRELDDNYFDIIISKASFEHFIDLDHLLIEMKNKLKFGGRIIAGFGPLYNSPYGDHNRLGHKFPWAHIILGEDYYINKINRNRKEKINSIRDLGLNGFSLKKYSEVFNSVKGLSIISFRTNVSKKISMRVFDLFTYFPFLKEYFTFNIYCILERTK